MLALAAALVLLVQPDTTFRPAPDTSGVEAVDVGEVAEDIARFRVRPVVSPSALYSGSKGFGIGGGVAVDDVLARGDHVQVEARLAQRLQGGQAEYLTGEPGRDRLVGVFGAAAWTTTRTRFTGHGPRSRDAGDLFLDRFAAESEARLAWAPAGRRGILLQPTGRLRFDRLRDVTEARDGAFGRALPSDLDRLAALEGADRYGAEAALSVVRDTRDIRSMPARGAYVEGEAARFQALDGSGLGFWRVRTLVYAFRPALLRIPFIPERGALFVRANGVVTRQDGDAPLPWVYLPDLDGDLLVGYPRDEFAGRDALSVGVGARGVIGQAIGAFLVEGVAVGMVGAAYDDVFEEFTPQVRLTTERVPPGEAVPLRPSLAVGLNLHYLDRERPIVGALVGVGPGGVTLASLRLIYGLTGYRPRLR